MLGDTEGDSLGLSDDDSDGDLLKESDGDSDGLMLGLTLGL